MKKRLRSPWKPHQTIAAGQAASLAGRRYADRLVPRLGDDFFDLLDEDIRTLKELSSHRSSSVEEVKGRTRELYQFVASTGRIITAVRAAIIARFPPRHPIRSQFGVSIKLKPRSTKSTIAALQMLIRGMEQYPTESAEIGLDPSDLTRFNVCLTEILELDAWQERIKDQRKADTSLAAEINLSVYTKLNRLKLAAALDLSDKPGAYKEIVGPFPGDRRTGRGLRRKRRTDSR